MKPAEEYLITFAADLAIFVAFAARAMF